MPHSDMEEDAASTVRSQQTHQRKQSFSLTTQIIDSSRQNHHQHQSHSRKVSTQPPKSSFSRRYSNNSDPKSTLPGATNVDPKAIIKYENTYKLGPDEDKQFKYLNVKECILRVMKTIVPNEKYDAKKCVRLCQRLSDEINQEVKKLTNSRHKIVSIVFCGEKKMQELRIASRCLWDTRYDNCVSIDYENESFFAIANVYGLYFE